MVSTALELKDQLDEDWTEFEAYVENDENHDNPDPRDIPWPNNLFFKIQILSEAWRVLEPIPECKSLLEAGDLAFPIANMIAVDYIQYPNSNQRVELTVMYNALCNAFGFSKDTEYINFTEMIDTLPSEYQEWKE